jgi:serine/threonine protein kinase
VATSLIGQQLGKYKVVELIGRGGMAAVYKGYQPELERYVAIKVLPPHPGQDNSFVERFRQEARTVARLQHPHITPLYDYGSGSGDENGTLYLVSPYLEGGSLADRIHKDRISLPDTETWLRQIGSALDYAHRSGIIHRDVKPDNVLLDREGRAQLTDFGIAKIIEGSTNYTATGGLIGTPAYMSPEQGQGLPLDYRTDLYSLAVVVFEMLTGQAPYAADTPMQVVFQHITAPVPSLSEMMSSVSPELDQVLQKALAKEPAQRYQSALEFMEAFGRAAKEQGPLLPAPPRPRTGPQSLATTIDDPVASIATSRMRQTMASSSTSNPVLLLGGFAIIAVLVVVVLLILTNRPPVPGAVEATLTMSATQQIAAVPSVPVLGWANFSTSVSPGDTVSVSVQNLMPPSGGRNYYAWLQNTGDGSLLPIGRLNSDALGSGQLSYTDADGTMLPARYNAILLGLEDGETDTPSGAAAYSGSVPREVTQALNAILLDITIPAEGSQAEFTGSLFAGVVSEATIGQQHAGLAAGATTSGAMHTHAEHTINILNGTLEDYDGDGRGANPGRGFGVMFFLDRILADLNTAASAPTANRALQSQIELIRVCSENARTWKDQIVELETEVSAADNLESVPQQLVEATELADALLNGVDLNENGQVEPFEGECGLQQIAVYGISVGNIDIVAGPLNAADS